MVSFKELLFGFILIIILVSLVNIVNALDESGDIINAPYAHSQGYTGDGIKVCIVDSGIKDKL